MPSRPAYRICSALSRAFGAIMRRWLGHWNMRGAKASLKGRSTASKRSNGNSMAERRCLSSSTMCCSQRLEAINRRRERTNHPSPERAENQIPGSIIVIPYLNQLQISSGTLAYALAAGKAIVSTPFFYAQELLSGGRGLLVRFQDSNSMAAGINLLLEQPRLGGRLSRRRMCTGGGCTGPRSARPIAGYSNRSFRRHLLRHYTP